MTMIIQNPDLLNNSVNNGDNSIDNGTNNILDLLQHDNEGKK